MERVKNIWLISLVFLVACQGNTDSYIIEPNTDMLKSPDLLTTYSPDMKESTVDLEKPADLTPVATPDLTSPTSTPDMLLAPDLEQQTSCGGFQQACCAGNQCGAGTVCSGGKCEVCGGLFGLCCAGNTCQGSSQCTGGTCTPCGQRTQVCCGGTTCFNDNSCQSGTCDHCGLVGEAACNGVCNDGSTNVDGMCQWADCGHFEGACCNKMQQLATNKTACEKRSNGQKQSCSPVTDSCYPCGAPGLYGCQEKPGAENLKCDTILEVSTGLLVPVYLDSNKRCHDPRCDKGSGWWKQGNVCCGYFILQPPGVTKCN